MGVSLEQCLTASSGVLKPQTVEFYRLVVATLLLAAGIEPNPGPNTEAVCELCGLSANVVQERNDLKTLKEELENLRKQLTEREELLDRKMKSLVDRENILLRREDSMHQREKLFCDRENILSLREDSMNEREKLHNDMAGEFMKKEKLSAEEESSYSLPNFMKITQTTSKGRSDDPEAPLKLCKAIEDGSVKDVYKILLAGGVSVEHRYEDNKTPLLLASISGHLPVVRFLIQQAGACTDVRDDKFTASALDWAVKYNHISVVEYLVKEAGMNASHKTSWGDTLLHIAAKKGYFDIVRFLVENNKEVIHTKNTNARNAIHLAVESGHLHIVKYLWEESGRIPIGKDIYGWTALHHACHNGHKEIIMYLLNTVGEDRSVRDNKRCTPFDYFKSKFSSEGF